MKIITRAKKSLITREFQNNFVELNLTRDERFSALVIIFHYRRLRRRVVLYYTIFQQPLFDQIRHKQFQIRPNRLRCISAAALRNVGTNK